MRNKVSRLKLTVNEAKTRAVDCRREGRFSRVYVCSMLLAEEGTELLEQDSVPETSAVQLQGDQRDDPAESNPTGGGKAGRGAQPETRWLGQVLLFGSSQQRLPIGGATCRSAPSPVAVRQTQRAGRREHAVSGEGPASEPWPGSTCRANLQFSAGDSMILSPRAGCVNAVCPVR
jgi:hypothetical protein